MAVRKRRKLKRSHANNALVVETVAIDSVEPYPKNVRLHPEQNIQAIIRSLDAFGQRTPIVVGGSNYVLKGCGTLEAMRRRGDETIHVVRVNHLTEAQEVAYAIADNKTSDTSTFDFESLADVLRYLETEEVDLAVTGFEEFEIEPLLSARFNVDPVRSKEQQEQESKFAVPFTAGQAQIIENAIHRAISIRIVDAKEKRSNILTEICKVFLDKTESKKRSMKRPRKKA